MLQLSFAWGLPNLLRLLEVFRAGAATAIPLPAHGQHGPSRTSQRQIEIAPAWVTLRPMRLLAYLVEAFIQGFGITRPSATQQRRVTLLLGGALLAAAVLGLLLGVAMVIYLHGNR